MDISDILSVAATVLAACSIFFALQKTLKSLTLRLSVEKKLVHLLAAELERRKIASDVTIELNRLTVCGTFDSEEDLANMKSQIDDAVKSAIRQLVKEEQQLVEESLHQPSKQGQRHYLRKILNNSLDELSHPKV